MTMDKIVTPYINDIKDAIKHIDEYAKGLTLRDLSNDDLRLDGIIRRLLIIGEAAKRFPEDVRRSSPSIPWKDIVGARNILVHDYEAIVPEEVWKIITEDLPVLSRGIADLEAKLKQKS